MENNNHPTDLSSITAAWFKACNIKVSNRYLSDSLTSHPDYPALTSLTDFLETGGMEYDAVQADASYIHEFNYPLLAHIKQPGNEYLYTINDVTEWDKQKTLHNIGAVLYYMLVRELYGKIMTTTQHCSMNKKINYLLLLL